MITKGSKVSREDWFMIWDDDDSVISIRVRRRNMAYKTALARARKVLREHGLKIAGYENLGVREVSQRVFEPEKRGNARCWDIRFHESQE